MLRRWEKESDKKKMPFNEFLVGFQVAKVGEVTPVITLHQALTL